METDPDGTQILMQLFILVLLTLVNAFFAGAEMAVVSVNKNRVKMLAKEGNKKAILIQSLFEDSTKFLSTIQVAITCAGFFSSASAATGISKVLSDWLEQFQIPYSGTISFFGVTILLMYFNLVFGELVPKRIALQKAEAFCFLTVQPIYAISKVLSPFIKLLSMSTNAFLHLIGMKTEDLEEAVSEEEIKALLEMGNSRGIFEEHEYEMINSVFSFDNKNARDVMTPRRDVFAIDIADPFEENIEAILESRHSRIPVYKDNIDNIIGILYMKDFMIAMQKKLVKQDIRPFLEKPFFVPDSKEADELFRELQRTQHHMAVLIDEYGGFSGIVTVEDLVEEIVGEINEEHDCVAPELVQIAEGKYMLDGGMLIADLNEKLDLDLKTENYDTVSGFLVECLGYIPEASEREIVAVQNVSFEIQEMKDNRITKVLLILQEKL